MAEQPLFRAFTIIQRDDKPFWLNIGVAFMHKDDQGLNIILQALPLDGKLVLRPFEAQGDGGKQNHFAKKKPESEFGDE